MVLPNEPDLENIDEQTDPSSTWVQNPMSIVRQRAAAAATQVLKSARIPLPSGTGRDIFVSYGKSHEDETLPRDKYLIINSDDFTTKKIRDIAAKANISEGAALQRALVLMEAAVEAEANEDAIAIIDKADNVKTRITGIVG